MAAAWNTARQYGRQLNEASWTSVLGVAYALFFGLAVLSLLTPAHWRAPVKALSLALPLMLIAAKDLVQLPDVTHRLRALRSQRAAWPRFVVACLPPALVGMARLDRALWRSLFCWLRRQPAPRRPDGLKLTYLEQGAYSTALAIGLFCVLVELPLDAALVPLFIDDSATVWRIHGAVAVGSIFSLAWLLGDRWRVRAGYHVLTATHLDLQIGVRASARIPLEAIADAQPLPQSLVQWRRANPCRPMELVNITPFDKPNLVLRLRSGADCAITHHGVERKGVRYVSLYLDRPQQLIAALAAAGTR